ncbi:DNA-binding transcriptional regulator, ArsR family [Paenibacillus barengoltzii]|uniref:ArsR/SmtB family transcription factor n=1 Tax=Paenibacillus barengoltzii TaxID=343517 RepID=UPI000A090877|nr:ArsR family transcriptional regulator [Paenibacillus barengoltzii]SME98945.1 DNA-binding transcriptional regulator, ArsR family [Paenibacillus barengoltzii]
MKVLYHPERDDIQLSSVLYALSDPIRLSVVAEMKRCGERPCNYFEVPIAKSTLSHHIRTLREAGIITTRIQGTQRFISVREEDLEARFPGLLNSILEAYEKTQSKEQYTESKSE